MGTSSMKDEMGGQATLRPSAALWQKGITARRSGSENGRDKNRLKSSCVRCVLFELFERTVRRTGARCAHHPDRL